jgi:glycosyltransferase involved in cell wall biosynthesis
MKLLFFVSDRSIGLTSLCTAQAKFISEKETIDLFCIAGEKEQIAGLSEEFASNGIKLERINGLDNHANFKQLAKQIAVIISEENIEKVHVQNNWQLALVVFAKFVLLRSPNFKIIYTLHGYRNNEPLKAIFARIIIGSALLFFVHRVICMSSELMKKFSFLGSKVSVIFLGVDPIYFQQSERNKIDGTLRLIFPAQFRSGKNHQMLIETIGEIVNDYGRENIKLILPGDGELRVQMQKLALNCGVSKIVEFPGLLTKQELVLQYSQSDIVIISSNSETFGQSIAEGIVMGKCMVSRPVGVASDIIVDRENGMIFKNKKQLKDSLLYLYDNRDKLKLYAQKVKENKELFKWERIAIEYENLYLA